MQKNPIISAILNFILFGAGYVYNGKKKQLGFGLILAWLVLRAADLAFFLNGTVMDIWYVLMAGLAVLQITFAIDGYKEAKEINSKG